MELRHLRYFVAVAEELHFGRAAERLHVSQPPLSQQIKQLEEEVAVRLFDRNKRWVRLTSGGRQFLEQARQVLAQADGAVLAARRAMGGEYDRLSVACAPWARLMGVPRILHHFSRLHRQIQIDIQTLDSVRQLRAVKTRTVDVGFMCPGSSDSDLQVERLAAHPLVVALPSNHRLAGRARLSPRDLAGEGYVMLATNVARTYAEIVTEYWEKAGVAMKERLTADQPHAVIDLVAAGAGFALVPSSIQEYEKKGIVCRRLDPAPPELELSLVWARGLESPAVDALLEVARQVIGQPKSRVGDDSRAHAQPKGSDLLRLAPHLLRQTGHARSNGDRPGGPLRMLRGPQLPRHDRGKSIGTTPARDVRVPSVVDLIGPRGPNS
jgi:DNA-binding transcriptional LysR family regulator